MYVSIYERGCVNFSPDQRGGQEVGNDRREMLNLAFLSLSLLIHDPSRQAARICFDIIFKGPGEIIGRWLVGKWALFFRT